MSIKTISLATIALALSANVNAALILTIDNYTADELSFSISGTFDADSIGSQPGWLAIKNDWSNNNGVHTEMFNASPLLSLNTIAFNGVAVGGVGTDTFILNDTSSYTDTIYWRNPNGNANAFMAGTVVTGSMTLTGLGAFNPADEPTLELLSGFDNTVNDWARLESSAAVSSVPVPAAVWLFGSGLLGLIGIARRKKV